MFKPVTQRPSALPCRQRQLQPHWSLRRRRLPAKLALVCHKERGSTLDCMGLTYHPLLQGPAPYHKRWALCPTALTLLFSPQQHKATCFGSETHREGLNHWSKVNMSSAEGPGSGPVITPIMTNTSEGGGLTYPS